LALINIKEYQLKLYDVTIQGQVTKKASIMLRRAIFQSTNTEKFCAEIFVFSDQMYTIIIGINDFRMRERCIYVAHIIFKKTLLIDLSPMNLHACTVRADVLKR